MNWPIEVELQTCARCGIAAYQEVARGIKYDHPKGWAVVTIGIKPVINTLLCARCAAAVLKTVTNYLSKETQCE